MPSSDKQHCRDAAFKMDKSRPARDYQLGHRVNRTVDKILRKFDRALKKGKFDCDCDRRGRIDVRIKSTKVDRGLAAHVQERLYQRLADRGLDKIQVEVIKGEFSCDGVLVDSWVQVFLGFVLLPLLVPVVCIELYNKRRPKVSIKFGVDPVE